MNAWADVIGWGASAILLATLVRQIVKQYTEGAESVSHWLFIGQSLASLGFVVYSVLLGNWVFIVTNSLILLTAVVGDANTGMHENKALACDLRPGRLFRAEAPRTEGPS